MAADPAELTLEVVSPLFMGGADPRSGDVAREGVRPPSLRGALRHWLRAVLACDDRAKLLDAEAALFGSASNPSRLVTRVRALPGVRCESWEAIKGRGVPVRLPSGSTRGRPMPAGGLAYLGDVALRRTRDAPARTAIVPGARYRLELRWRGSEPDEGACRLVAASLWLLCRLGSLGARANRGFGALQATVERPGFLGETLRTFPPEVRAVDPAALADELGSAAAKLRTLRKGTGAVDGYPNLSVCEARVAGDAFRGWPEALEWIGTVYREYRRGVPIRRRLAFGLPIPQRQGRPLSVDDLSRRASPLRFRPVRLAGDSYAIVVVLFRDQLFPKTPADRAVLDEFLERVGGHVVRF